tara:strand:+ start:2363 stop:2710 length:348 start_codon:yes stop_codon:yes gene_type:complete
VGTPLLFPRGDEDEARALTTNDNSCGSTKRDVSHIVKNTVSSTNTALGATLANAIATARARCAFSNGELQNISGAFFFWEVQKRSDSFQFHHTTIGTGLAMMQEPRVECARWCFR